MVLVVVLLGVSSFAILTKSQVDKEEPAVFIINSDENIPDEFRSKLQAESYIVVDEADTPSIFPTEDISLFGIKEGITDIDEIMDWARKNKQKEVYFYY